MRIGLVVVAVIATDIMFALSIAAAAAIAWRLVTDPAPARGRGSS